MKILDAMISAATVLAIFFGFLFLAVIPAINNVEPCGWCHSQEMIDANRGCSTFTRLCEEKCNVVIPVPTPCCPCSPMPTANALPTLKPMINQTMQPLIVSWANESGCINTRYPNGTVTSRCNTNNATVDINDLPSYVVHWWNYTVSLEET